MIKISQDELRERFGEMLKDSYGEVKLYGYTFDPDQILRECDPTAYRCELANFANTLSDCGFEVEGY